MEYNLDKIRDIVAVLESKIDYSIKMLNEEDEDIDRSYHEEIVEQYSSCKGVFAEYWIDGFMGVDNDFSKDMKQGFTELVKLNLKKNDEDTYLNEQEVVELELFEDVYTTYYSKCEYKELYKMIAIAIEEDYIYY